MNATCHVCRLEKPLLFGRWCLPCWRSAPSVRALMEASDAFLADPVPAGHLRCSWCEEVLPLADYYPSHARKGGWCKECCKANARRAYAGDPQPRK